MAHKLKFEEAPRLIKTRTQINQIGPDTMRQPDGARYPVSRTTNTLFDVDGVTGGDDGIFPFPAGSIDSSAVGKLLYTYEYDSYHAINGINVFVVGIDVECSTATPGVLSGTRCLIVSAEMMTVSKSGNDSNSGSPAFPTLTIQAAIDAAVVAGYTHVIIMDSGTYDEKLDLKGITVEAASGQGPTIRFPMTGWTGAATVGGNTVNGFAEFTMSGVPYVWAATSGGLYRSVDGITWAVFSAITDDLRGICVYRESLYVSNNTNNRLDVFSSAGVQTSITAATIGFSNNIQGGIFSIGDALILTINDPPEMYAIYYNSAWNFYNGVNVDINYIFINESINRRFCFFINYENGVYGTIDIETGDYESESSIGSPVGIYSLDSRYMLITTAGVYSINNIFQISDISKVSDHGVSDASGFVVDPRGWLYIFGASNYAISRDNGRTWYTYGTAPAAKAGYAPSIFFRGVGLVAKTTNIAYDDQVHIRSSTDEGKILGFFVDGINFVAQSLCLAHIDSNSLYIYYCNSYNHYYGVDGKSGYSEGFKTSNSIYHDMNNFLYLSYANEIRYCYIYNISNIAIDGYPSDIMEYTTITGCWIGNSILSDETIYIGCVIYGNSVDIYSNNKTTTVISINSIIGASVGIAVVGAYSNADPLLLADGSYMDTYSGFPIDSVAKDLDAGARKYSRTETLATPKSWLLDYLPVRLSLQYKASNFTSNDNESGDYSESWDGMKRHITLAWQDDSWSTPIEYHRIVDMLKLEDRALLFGKSDESGEWETQLNTVPKLEASTSGTLVTRSLHPVCGVDQLAGWYLKVYDSTTAGYLYLRITSNTEGDGTSAVTFEVAAFPSGASIAQDATLEVVYLPVKIDKSGAFSGTQYGYVSTPLTGYSLTLREVTL